MNLVWVLVIPLMLGMLCPPGQSINGSIYILPLFLAAIMTTFIYFVGRTNPTFNVFTHPAFGSISTFTQVLPGFYIAALSAIAAYTNPRLDNMIGPSNVLLVGIPLSRRRYLTLLFGYLTAISIVAALMVFFFQLSYLTKILRVSQTIFHFGYFSCVFLFFTIFFQMLILTFFGIHYLADRMHRP